MHRAAPHSGSIQPNSDNAEKLCSTLSNTIHTINSKWIKDLNIRPEDIKLLEENIGKTLSDINHSRIPYDPSPRILETKAKINKWDLIKLKSFCTMKETISEVEKTAFRMGENNSKQGN